MADDVARITVYLPHDVLKAVRHAAIDEKIFVSDLMTKAAKAYLAVNGIEASEDMSETVMPTADKARSSTATILGLLRKAGPEGIKAGELRREARREGRTLGATDVALAVLIEAGVIERRGQSLMPVRASADQEGMGRDPKQSRKGPDR